MPEQHASKALMSSQPSQFDIITLEDEVRVDRLCEALLCEFRDYQREALQLSPEAAGANARGADYLLREFIVADRRDNLLDLDPLRIRQFAGHWYILRALEPNMQELEGILQGTAAFYRYLAELGRYPAGRAAEIDGYCRDLGYYRSRIASFWELEGDGFAAWASACPLAD